MKNILYLLCFFFLTPISSFAVGGSTGGGARPTAVYSIERNEGTSTFAVGSYENQNWKVKKLSMPSDSIPEDISGALEESEQSHDWAQIQK